ncbi:hypothetical protein BO82DRAFT_242277, partial [Aspergillus uvarum CBS 121591]
DRNTQEQIRKRRHNLFRRIKEFRDRYDIETWCTMRMPSGRIYVFNTNPNEPSPLTEEVVSSMMIAATKNYSSSLVGPSIDNHP